MVRDLYYERENVLAENMDLIKCKNYEFCDGSLPAWWFGTKGKYICLTCDFACMSELEIAVPTEDCPVCMDRSHKHMKFPKCKHWVCLECARKILLFDESRYHISPVPYGCPPCPNGCLNPIRGPQCGCIEWMGEFGGEGSGISVFEKWQCRCPDDYDRWNHDEKDSIEAGETTPGSVFGSRVCPLCRAIQ